MTKQEKFFTFLPDRYYELFNKWADFIGNSVNDIAGFSIIKNKKSDINIYKERYPGHEIAKDVFLSFMIAIIENKDNPHEKFVEFSNDKKEIGKIIEKSLKEYINAENSIRESKKIKISGDIVITDPCYISNNICNIGEGIVTNMKRFDNPCIASSTIYGDWSCGVLNTDTQEHIGKFCADAGLVIVCSLNDAIKFNKDFEKWAEEHNWCVTIIKGFDGEIEIAYEPEEYEYKGEKCVEKSCVIYGKGNINFKGFQIGF